jgi:lipopolysaccharide heptosyltransferase II
MEVGEPLWPDAGSDAGQMTAELNLRVEQAVRRSPQDWFWVHRRWKTPRPNFLLRHYKRGIRTAPPLSESSLKPFRALVRSPNWLGDACMAVPAVRAIKRGRPDCHLTVLTPSRLAGLWRAVTDVDEVLEIPAGAGVWGASRAVRQAGHRFDAGVLLPNSPRAALEMWLGGVPDRFGVAGSWRRRLLTKVVKEREAPGRTEHHSQHYLRIARELGAEIDEPGLFAPLPTDGVGAPDGGRVRLGLCPGAEYGPAKRWPAARFAEVAAAVCRERADADWVLFGVAADAGPAAEVEAALPAGRCENVAGQTDLAGLMAGLRRCHLVLTNDTGTMHLAALLGVPVVAVFGSTDPAWTGPLGDGHAVVRRHVECSPCFLRECPLDLRCLLEVEPARVLDAVLARLPASAACQGVPTAS